MVRATLAVVTLAAFMSAALAQPVTVKSCDREVTFDKTPTRAVSNDVNLTEMMLALGLRDRMVGYTGISGWKTLVATFRDGVKELPELSARYPTKEVLLGANADFYFAGWNYGLEIGGEVTPQSLEPFGIKTYELTESCIHIMKRDRSTMEDMYNDLLNLGRIFRVEPKAEALVESYRKRLAEIEAKRGPIEKPLRVFVYDSGEDKPFTAGRFAIPTAMIEAAGGKNIMEDVETSWTHVAWEPVIERNPEVIIIVNYGEVTADEKIAFMKSNPSFASIDAVKNNRFVVLDYVEATPGPRNMEAIDRLTKAFWPNAM